MWVLPCTYGISFPKVAELADNSPLYIPYENTDFKLKIKTLCQLGQTFSLSVEKRHRFCLVLSLTDICGLHACAWTRPESECTEGP